MIPDADRIYIEQIDLLNTTLVETRRERDAAEEKLTAERDAHERTKAELADEQRAHGTAVGEIAAQGDWQAVARRTAAECDAAQAEAAAATKRANEVPGLSAALDEARCGLEQVRDNRACSSKTCGQIAERVLSGKVNVVALRALAARVPLLERVTEVARHAVRTKTYSALRAALAALDAQETK